jgi:hypothetical protein
MNRIPGALKNAYVWASTVILATSLMVLGWAESYPVSYPPQEVPVLTAVSPLFWVGLALGFAGLAGLVLASASRYVHLLSACLFVLFLTAPQFLYLSWGSDAGMLPGFVHYHRAVGNLDIQRDVAINPYFQWPLSILFHSFLVDAFRVNHFTAVQIGFFFVAVSVAGGLFMLWLDGLPRRPESSRAAFWGIVVYFVGFFWLLNWQAVPYSFSLALFFPMLALFGRRSWQDTVLILLLFVIGLESHALFGVWGPAIVAFLIVLGALTRRRKLTVSLVLLMIIAQTTLILYKNTRFFKYLVLNLQGYYQAFLAVGGSDRLLNRHAQSALSPLPADLLAASLKVLSWFDLILVGFAFLLAAWFVIRNRRLQDREVSFLGVGSLHLGAGIALAAIGTRSLQLLGLAPAFFVVDALVSGTHRLRQVSLICSLIALLLFPAAVIRGHQQSPNYVRPAGSLVTEMLARTLDEDAP